MKHSIIYILSVIAINASFSYIPHFTLPDGSIWSIGSVIAGLVFVARDFAQREVGHIKVLGLMAIAGAISYITSSPFVAIASLVAFSVSELVDYAAYTLTNGNFKRRVVVSSLVGVPVDTLIFLMMIDGLSAFGFAVMTASKLVALTLIFARFKLKAS